MTVSCPKCNKEFKHPYLLKRHLNRKNPCKQVEKNLPQLTSINLNLPQLTSINLKKKRATNNTNMSEENNTLKKCLYCDKKYSSKNELRHFRTSCLKIPKDIKNEIIIKYNKHKKNKNNISIVSTINKDNSNNNITHITNYNLQNNNIVNNITNKIEVKVNPIGKEDMSFLTKDDKLKILNRIYNSIPELVKTIHNHPKNRNFYLPNLNKNIIACINNNNEIEYNDYDSICYQILQDNVDRIDELYNELESEINDSIKNKLENVIKKVENGELDTRYIKDIKLYIMNISKRNKEELLNYIENIEKIK
tara:strand:+ start:293 stop:1213 length:921 start_codon:yes stop_codon:yes gene_type:complete